MPIWTLLSRLPRLVYNPANTNSLLNDDRELLLDTINDIHDPDRPHPYSLDGWMIRIVLDQATAHQRFLSMEQIVAKIEDMFGNNQGSQWRYYIDTYGVPAAAYVINKAIFPVRILLDIRTTTFLNW
ncbi:UNVERIFIED_CONTAM: hypothetical protein HDU68_002614 [Siphonaria sp. JEL0065]|nr:hypothetical protein HDU68_002614 [Siphonaria sp. JEL0065]